MIIFLCPVLLDFRSQTGQEEDNSINLPPRYSVHGLTIILLSVVFYPVELHPIRSYTLPWTPPLEAFVGKNLLLQGLWPQLTFPTPVLILGPQPQSLINDHRRNETGYYVLDFSIAAGQSYTAPLRSSNLTSHIHSHYR